MHTKARPKVRLQDPDAYGSDIAGEVTDVLRERIARAGELGVAPDAIVVDPGVDYAKTPHQTVTMLRDVAPIRGLGRPVLWALSRKDFVGETLGLDVDERLEGTLAATAVAAWHGAGVFRAHDVVATRRVLDMVAAIRGDLPPSRAVRGLV